MGAINGNMNETLFLTGMDWMQACSCTHQHGVVHVVRVHRRVSGGERFPCSCSVTLDDACVFCVTEGVSKFTSVGPVFGRLLY